MCCFRVERKLTAFGLSQIGRHKVRWEESFVTCCFTFPPVHITEKKKLHCDLEDHQIRQQHKFDYLSLYSVLYWE